MPPAVSLVPPVPNLVSLKYASAAPDPIKGRVVSH